MKTRCPWLNVAIAESIEIFDTTGCMLLISLKQLIGVAQVGFLTNEGREIFAPKAT
jgi:hypothetical protein